MRATASIVPSSPFLSKALIQSIDFSRVRTVVELGAGTGSVTNAILKKLRSDGRLYAIDNNEQFVEHLRLSCRDSRLVALHCSAEDLSGQLKTLGVPHVDAVVSSLGLTAMESAQRDCILGQIQSILRADGILTQYQYFFSRFGCIDLRNARPLPFNIRRFLETSFREVLSEYVMLNVPPARVFTCTRPVGA